MPDYVSLPIETDPDALAQSAFDYLEARIPNWAPDDGQLDVWLIAAISRIAAELRDVASDVPTSIFRFFGANIIGLTPEDATPATGQTTWTVRDASGYLIEAGTVVSIRDSLGQDIGFEVLENYEVQVGQTVTNTGGVTIQALEEGAAGSGLVGVPTNSVDLVDQLDFVTAITLTGPTTGGIDSESDEDYLARLTGWLQLLAPRPIIASDFAAYAIQVVPGIYRALAIDNFIPPANFTAERAVAVIPIDVAGEPVSGGTKTQLDTDLQARRETNFIVNVVDPTYTIIDVSFAAKSFSGYDALDVKARAEAAVAEYLSPANWGLPPFGDRQGWIAQPVVRRFELSTVINNVEGVDYISTLTLAVPPGALGTSDITMTGVGTLPRPGTIVGTIT